MTTATSSNSDDTNDRSGILRRALVELKAARAEAAEANEAREAMTEPIAVVGVGCRFPGGGDGAAAFWDALVEGRSGIGEVPSGRWSLERFFDADPEVPGATYSRHGGFVEGVAEFDAALFGIAPREAAAVDPQHRLVLEVAWEALEHAGIAPDSLRGSATGVFVGMGGSDYERLTAAGNDPALLDAYTAVGGSQNFAANRLSYSLGLQGPSLVTDTACSSSLVALHLAVQALRGGECSSALVGGVNLLLAPGTTVALSKARMLSPSGQCRTFDAGADGYVRGEGCGVVVLQPLSRARAEGREVLAVIRGTAVNQDGKSSGLTVPHAAAQQDVIRRALEAGGVDPAAVGYVEAHGTGTPLGDPIEVRALAQVLAAGRSEDQPLRLGSVKTNIGHLEAAAGIAGLIKTVLTLHHGTIPPQLNLDSPNPHIDWDELPVSIPTQAVEWADPERAAGVSSFGFGGTNAHVVLTAPEPAGEPDTAPASEGPVVVKVAGHTPAALRAVAAQLASVANEGACSVRELAYVANTARADLAHRATAVAATPGELAEQLAHIAATVADTHVPAPSNPPRLAFLVPGQGSRLAGALRGLYPEVEAVAAAVDAVVRETDGHPVVARALIALTGAGPEAEEAEEAEADVAAAEFATYLAAVGLGAYWESLGVRPDIVTGHGVGACAAAALAGVFSPADGARLALAGTDSAARAKVLDGIELRLPSAGFMPDSDGRLIAKELATADYWLREDGGTAPVPTAAAMRAALSERADLVVELGAGAGSGYGRPLATVARLWRAGAPVDWARVSGPRPARLPALPAYPFQRRTHWALPGSADGTATAARRAVVGDDGVALRPRILRSATGDTIGETRLSLADLPFLAEHRVHGRLVVPGVVHLELVLRCAAEAFGGRPVRIERLALSRPLTVGDHDEASVQVVIGPPTSEGAEARVFSADAEGGWQLHLTTRVVAETDTDTAPGEGGGVDVVREQCQQPIADGDFYRQAWHPSFELGPSFRLVTGARRGPGAAVASLVPPAADAAGVVAGVRPELLLLDACVQLVAVAAGYGEADGWDGRPVRLGTGYESMTVHRPDALETLEKLECAAVLREAQRDTLSGDITLAAADGTVVAELRGVSFRPVSPELLARLGTPPRPAGERSPSGAPDVAALAAAPAEERERAVLAHLTGLLARVLGAVPGEVRQDVPVIDLADSLMMAELKTDVERDLGVSIPLEALFEAEGLRELAGWVADEVVGGGIPVKPEPGLATRGSAPDPAAQSPQGLEMRPSAPGLEMRSSASGPEMRPSPQGLERQRRPKTMAVGDMVRLAELDEGIKATATREPDGAAPDATLLTGATGFVGAFLLAELLERRTGDVLCLVRAEDEAHGLRRILDNLAAHGLDVARRHHDRVVPVVGDLVSPKLGLDDEDFAALHARVGSILHCGGMVKWTYPYGKLAPANVDGTREVLRLATVGAVRPVHFISTVGVFSSTEYTADLVRESDELLDSGPLAVGYAQSKWVAEHMIRTAHERGVPVTIHRINTGGHSRTGTFNRLDHLCMMLKGCIEAGIAPDEVRMPVQPAPIDYVAAAVVELSARPELDGRTFHLVNGAPLAWSEFFDHVEEFGYPLRRMPFEEWKAQVTGRSSGTMALLGLAPFLNDTVDHVRLPLSDAARTEEALAGTGVHCPPLDGELIATYLRGFIAEGFVDPPAAPAA
ncbi:MULTISPECIES: thioester reductase domain-containing protein [unclassified Streptomyces]|uniref:thioester reductase domain-containing protein n=1 Tax=unclassified Streptomyces TaxID=2593676 RepID=UPI00278C3822|nr:MULTISPECIES: thioester reductase domain-containing protein [unclassified Streptomyces]